ncbi:hypothetical protein [Sphingomonas morindae]|uniref:Tetratricopeptide repeat protein n=1 Tax=Sphingomonas morindae TaxID=1541170 RepID=A0ABY4X524_9SPHN|nr:hypothetical protein [Sphingomonas morindae]USI71989.1 hypothetical protein LHA26_11785 [Sphingomonas morindae]
MRGAFTARAAALLPLLTAALAQPGGAQALAAFSARLVAAPPLTGPAVWQPQAMETIWARLARSPGDRQPVRWDYARNLIGRGFGAEAAGVLTVMRQADPDLALVPHYRLAYGAALVEIGHADQALSWLAPRGDEPAPGAERCAWLARALAEAGRGGEALRHMACAAPALNQRVPAARTAFVAPLAAAAVDAGDPARALRWLAALPDADPAANVQRGRALAALGRSGEARLRLGRVETAGPLPLRMAARLARIEAGVADHSMTVAAARAALDRLRFAWRGGPIEARALLLAYRLADQAKDVPGALAAGATLMRYFPARAQPPGFGAALQDRFAHLLEDGRTLPLIPAADLFWSYRDLVPSGPAGDRLVAAMANRLQLAGLYRRAASLLEFQLFNRTIDLARGPLSVRVASLYILAGDPARAVRTLRQSDAPGFDATMLNDRRRIEAIALHQLGRVDQALALLADVPDGTTLRAEILWKQRRWQQLAETMPALLPAPGRLDAVGQTLVLRQAIALAMLGRSDALAALHARYAAGLAGAPSAAVVALLGAPGAGAGGASIARAMAALPSASPAAGYSELFDAPAGGPG